jgi:hypothetical protein
MAPTGQQKRKSSEDSHNDESPPLSPRKRSKREATCTANQPLIDALHDLSLALFGAQSVDARNRFKGVALRRAADALANLDYEIGDGSALATANSPTKVPGVGRGIAAYIDEFLETGEIYEIQKYKDLVEKNKVQDFQGEDEQPNDEAYNYYKEKDASSSTQPNHDPKNEQVVKINRAPVLTLWVIVVAERQGFTREEACTYGKWVSGTLARSKGRSLGIYEAKEETDQERSARHQQRHDGVQYVEAFANIKIPTVEWNGKHLAVSANADKPLDPVAVQDYLLRSFGGQLGAVEAAMKELAADIPPAELRTRAYHLYENFRPEWKGWGKKSLLYLSAIRKLAKAA